MKKQQLQFPQQSIIQQQQHPKARIQSPKQPKEQQQSSKKVQKRFLTYSNISNAEEEVKACNPYDAACKAFRKIKKQTLPSSAATSSSKPTNPLKTVISVVENPKLTKSEMKSGRQVQVSTYTAEQKPIPVEKLNDFTARYNIQNQSSVKLLTKDRIYIPGMNHISRDFAIREKYCANMKKQGDCPDFCSWESENNETGDKSSGTCVYKGKPPHFLKSGHLKSTDDQDYEQYLQQRINEKAAKLGIKD